jgi:hypothetical protein
MRSKTLGVLAVVAAILAGVAVAGAAAPRSAMSAAVGAGVDPGNFVRHVTNPYFPLRPGTLFVYRGSEEGQTQVDRVLVTHRTKEILGVHTTVVRDVVRHKGHLLEKTFDWYAQDKNGTVWYFGENTRSFEDGKVSTEGSWKAGRDGARPGIIMKADPRPTDAYRQEFYRNHAEDQAWVVKRGGSVRVPLGKLHHKLVTFEWARLEPGIIAKKVYARGFGIALERSMSGPQETSKLVRVRRP